MILDALQAPVDLVAERLHTKVCKPSSKPGTMLVGSHRPRLGPCHQPLPGRRLQTKVQPARTSQSKEQRKPAHPPSRPKVRASQGSGNPASIQSHLMGKSQGTQFSRVWRSIKVQASSAVAGSKPVAPHHPTDQGGVSAARTCLATRH